MKVPRDPVLHKLRHHRKAGPHSPPGRATRPAREAIAEGLDQADSVPHPSPGSKSASQPCGIVGDLEAAPGFEPEGDG